MDPNNKTTARKIKPPAGPTICGTSGKPCVPSFSSIQRVIAKSWRKMKSQPVRAAPAGVAIKSVNQVSVGREMSLHKCMLLKRVCFVYFFNNDVAPEFKVILVHTSHSTALSLSLYIYRKSGTKLTMIFTTLTSSLSLILYILVSFIRHTHTEKKTTEVLTYERTLRQREKGDKFKRVG